jgi:hypothetical protein
LEKERHPDVPVPDGAQTMGQGSRQVKGAILPNWVNKNDPNAMVPIVNEPKDLIVIVAGGAGGKSMWCPTAGAQSLAVSKLIERGA